MLSKQSFTFFKMFENVGTVFHICSAIMAQKKIFREKYQFGLPKIAEFYADFLFAYTHFCALFLCFLLLTFIRGILEIRHQRI